MYLPKMHNRYAALISLPNVYQSVVIPDIFNIEWAIPGEDIKCVIVQIQVADQSLEESVLPPGRFGLKIFQNNVLNLLRESSESQWCTRSLIVVDSLPIFPTSQQCKSELETLPPRILQA